MLGKLYIYALALFALISIGLSQAAAEQDRYDLLQTFPAVNGVAGSGGGLLGPLVVSSDAGSAGWALYGVASRGGRVYSSSPAALPSCSSGCGLVYKLAPPSRDNPHWVVTRLYVFNGGAFNDTGAPSGGLAFDPAGAAYGVAHNEVFRLTRPQAGQYFWNKTVVRRMGVDASSGPYIGGFPQSSVVLDAKRSLYGTTSGGQNDSGLVYQLTMPASGTGPWSETVLHRFQGPRRIGSDYPYSASSGPLVIDQSGTIYGAFTYQGNRGLGEVFKLTPPKPGQTQWVYTTLYRPEIHGYYLASTSLVRDQTGTLYFTLSAGPTGAGAVMSLKPPQAGTTDWLADTLFSFSGPDGTNPGHLSVLDRSGSIYGATDARIVTTAAGSRYLGGVVFRLDPPRGDRTTWTKTVLDALSAGVADGALTRDAAGAIYTIGGPAPIGTDGAIFRLTPP